VASPRRRLIAIAAVPFVGGIEHPAVAALALPLTALVSAALRTVMGIWAHTFDNRFITSIVITPLALLGCVFHSARSPRRPWSSLTKIDPIYHWSMPRTPASLASMRHRRSCRWHLPRWRQQRHSYSYRLWSHVGRVAFVKRESHPLGARLLPRWVGVPDSVGQDVEGEVALSPADQVARPCTGNSCI
jgi:hypothetical protein